MSPIVRSFKHGLFKDVIKMLPPVVGAVRGKKIFATERNAGMQLLKKSRRLEIIQMLNNRHNIIIIITYNTIVYGLYNDQ